MFNYSLSNPYMSNGMFFNPYSMDAAAGMYNFNNYTNPYAFGLQNNIFAQQPTFTSNSTSSSSTSKKGVTKDYTSYTASSEIKKSSKNKDTDTAKNLGKSLLIATGIVAAGASIIAFVSGARNFNGSTLEYAKSLMQKAGNAVKDGAKNFYVNCDNVATGVADVGKTAWEGTQKAAKATRIGIKYFFHEIGKGLKHVL